MDASRLFEVINDVEEDLEGGLTKLLAVVVQQYTVARDGPTVDNGPAIQAALASLFEHIDKSKFSNYPPSKAGILEVIGGNGLLGPELKHRLTRIVIVPDRTAAGVVLTMGELQAQIITFRKTCTMVKTGFKSLGLAPHSTPNDQFEVGVLIPKTLVKEDFSLLLKEMSAWNRIVRAFQEVAGEEEREVTPIGLATGSYETYIQVGYAVAISLSLTIDKILEWYTKILAIREHSQKLNDLGIPTPEAKAHEKELVDQGIQTLVTEIMKQVHVKVDAHRKNELETNLRISIKHVARFVDRGGNVEITAAQPEIPVKPAHVDEDAPQEELNAYNHLLKEHKKLSEQVDALNKLIRAGSVLNQLPARSEPVLQLEIEPDGDADKAEKPAKKKSEK